MRLISLILLAFMSASLWAQSDPSVMVIYVAAVKFEDSDDNYSKVLTSRVREELSKSLSYKLANPDFEKSIELAKNYNESCLSLEECARKEAKAVDADLVLISDVTRVDGQCRLTMRLENIYTKEILKNKNLRSSCTIDDLEEKTIDLVYLIMKKDAIKNIGLRKAKITSDPSGAALMINNRAVGTTPFEGSIPTGQVKLMMQIEGNNRYAPILVNELIEDSKDVFIYNKVFAEKNAFINPDIKPTSAWVKINGMDVEYEHLKKIPVEIRQDMKIEIEAKGHHPRIVRINGLDADEEYQLLIRLEPLPCKVTITSNPDSASVTQQNGTLLGTTPYTGELLPGEHMLVVARPAYKNEQISFYCESEQAVNRVVVLKHLKYSESEQEEINQARFWRRSSYVGFALGLGAAYLTYSSYQKFQDADAKYKKSNDPAEIVSLREKRDKEKASTPLYAAGTAAIFGVSALFFHWGTPPQFSQSHSFQIAPENGGGRLAWHYNW